MVELHGINIKDFDFDFDKYKRIGDLLSYGASSLISLFRKGDRLFIVSWVDQDETYNRWFVFETTKTDILKYFDKEITYYDLTNQITRNWITSIELDSNFNVHNPQLLNRLAIPTDYLPSKNSFYEEGDADEDLIKKFLKDL